MSARHAMKHRAAVERDTATGTDTFGHPVKPVMAALVTEPCFAWSKQRRDVQDGGKLVLVEDLRCLLPLATTVAPGDEFASVQDRRGNTIIAGRVRVLTTQYKHDHVEAGLERVA